MGRRAVVLLCVATAIGRLATAQSADDLRIVARDPAGHGLLCRHNDKRILMVHGTPEQMGTAHGRLLKPHVRSVAERVAYLVGAGYTAVEGEWFFERMDDIVSRTRPHVPERFLRECDALSRSAGIRPRDGRVTNFFPELFHCSGFAVRNEASADGRVLHARVLDYMHGIGLQNHAVIVLWMPEGNHAWLSLGYAGFIGTVTCMNEHGLAMGELGGAGEEEWDGMPMSFLMRAVMETAQTVPEALKLMRETPRTCEYYYVLSDRDRTMAGVRATPETFRVMKPGQQQEELPPVPADVVLLSSGQRARTLSKRLHDSHGRIDVARMKTIIKRPVAMRSNLHSAIFRPETLDMWCADAGNRIPACDQPYVRVNLKQLRTFYRRELRGARAFE